MRVLLGVAMAAAAAGLASMAHLTASSTWLVLLPGFILAGIGLGVTSTGLASAALSAVEPAHAGMAVEAPGEYAAPGRHRHRRGRRRALRVPGHHRHPARPSSACPPARRRPAGRRRSPPALGTRVAAAVPPVARTAVIRAARSKRCQRPQRRTARRGRVRRARRDSRIRLRTRPSQTAAAQPRPRRQQRTGRPAPGAATGRAGSNGRLVAPGCSTHSSARP